MFYTLAHLETLQAALASGTLRVRFEDRQIEYRSLEELMAAIQIVKGELLAVAGVSRPTRSYAKFSKG